MTNVHGVWLSDKMIQDLESAHNGKLVRDVLLSDILNKLSQKYRKEHGKFPQLLRPSEYPGEEFAAHRIEFFKFGLLVPSKWHAYIRRKRVFAGVTLHV